MTTKLLAPHVFLQSALTGTNLQCQSEGGKAGCINKHRQAPEKIQVAQVDGDYYVLKSLQNDKFLELQPGGTVSFSSRVSTTEEKTHFSMTSTAVTADGQSLPQGNWFGFSPRGKVDGIFAGTMLHVDESGGLKCEKNNGPINALSAAFCLAPLDEAEDESLLQVFVTADTATVSDAASGRTVVCQFLVDDKWTDEEELFTPNTSGRVVSNRFGVESPPTKLRMSIKGQAEWSFWRLTCAGIELVKHPGGNADGPTAIDVDFRLDGKTDEASHASHEYDLGGVPGKSEPVGQTYMPPSRLPSQARPTQHIPFSRRVCSRVRLRRPVFLFRFVSVLHFTLQ